MCSLFGVVFAVYRNSNKSSASTSTDRSQSSSPGCLGAFYDSARHRIEMQLVCRQPHRVTVPHHGTVEVEAGESIRTEISCKYDRNSVAALFEAAGLRVVEFRTDPSGRFGVVEGAPIA